MAAVNESLAEEITGRKKKPGFLVLDSSVMEHAETHRIIREDIKQNKIEFIFPSGLNELDVFEEIAALAIIDGGDSDEKMKRMYDVTMQLLVDKDVVINIRNYDGTKTTLCEFHVVDRYQNLRGIEAVNSYPTIILWMCEFMAEHLLKKYPLLGQPQSGAKAATKTRTKLKRSR